MTVVDPTIDPSYTINADENQPEALAAPEITLKKGTESLKDGATVSNRANDIKFEIAAADGVSFYYTVDGTEPAKTSASYSEAVTVTAPDKDTEETVTIKAIAVKPATGTEGQDGYVAEQISSVTTATVTFAAKGKTISIADGSDTATVTIGGKSLADEEYAITNTTRDIEAVVSADGKMFEVMYNIDGGTWTSAVKKGMASKPYADRAVSYGTGTYIIPKTALSGSVSVCVFYLKEVTLDWQEDAGWDSVSVTADVTRNGSDSTEFNGIWGARYPAVKDTKDNVLFVPQNTKVGLELEPCEKVDFTFKTVNYKKTGSSDSATNGTISGDGKSASVEIANVGTDDYTVAIGGESKTYSRTAVIGEDNKPVSFNRGVAKINPRETYTIQAYTTGAGKKTYPIEQLEVNCGSEDMSKLVELTRVEASQQAEGDDAGETKYTGTWTLKATAAAATKNLAVTVKGADGVVLTTFTLNVAPAITTVTVAKASGDKINQTIGTKADYIVTPNNKTTNDELGIKITDASGALDAANTTITKETNGTWKLSVAAKAVEAGKEAEIVIYNKSDYPSEAPNIEGMKTLKVATVKPAWDKKTAPTVKQTDSDDISLTLSMTLPNGAVETVEGAKYYYKVTTTAPDNGKNDYTADKQARYYEAAGKTTSQKINMIAQNFGKGRSETFTADVELLLYAEAGGTTPTPAPNPDNENKNSTNPASYTGVSVYAEGDNGEGGDGGDGGGTGEPTTPPTGETPDTSGTATTMPTGTLLATSKLVTVKGLKTKAPYYADKITLKKEKAASGIYTGQTAEVAAVDFGKNTTWNRDEDVKAWVAGNETNASGDNKISVHTDVAARDVSGGALTVKNRKVTLDVGKNVTPGKYTICVEQIETKGIPENAVPSRATLQITVVQGIYTITASSQKTIYAPAKKASAAAKITTVFNGNKAKPKTAKVAYTLGTKEQNGTFTPAAEDSNIKKWVDVKTNGSVTIKKGYAEAADADKIENGKFAVRVKAADYPTNETDDIVEFEIVVEAQKLGDVVLVKKVQAGSDDTSRAADTYELVTGENGKFTIPANEVSTTYVRVLNPVAAAEDAPLTDASFVDPKLYTLTFSKKNDVGVKADNMTLEFKGTKIVKDVTIKAQATDGGKAKAANDKKPPKLDITYEAVTGTKLQITTDSAYADFSANNTTSLTTPTGAVIKVKAVDGNDNDLKGHLVDYKVKVDGGATIVNNNGNKDNLDIALVMKKATAVVTLTNQAGKNPVAYTITNANFTELKAAPAVSLAKKQSFYAKYDNVQTLDFVIPKWNETKNGAGTDVAKIKITAGTDKASQDLFALIVDGSKEQNYTKTTEKITVMFNSTKSVDAIKNACLYFDFVKSDGSTVCQTSKAVKVSTVLLKKSYKLNTKYNMSAKDAANVTLVHSGKPTGVAKKQNSEELNVEFTKILNANIKGEVNHFRDAFDFDASSAKLSLKDPDYAVKDYGKEGKYKGINNLIGFVVYTVHYEDGTEESFTTQITINIDIAKKPAINGLKTVTPPVLAATDMAPEISVITSKKAPVNLVAVYFEGNDDSKIFALDDTKKGAYTDGVVTLKLADSSAAPTTYKKMDGKLYVLPADSYYVKEWSENQTSTSADDTPTTPTFDSAAFLKENGIELAVKIDVKDPAKTTKLVKVDNKQSKVSMADAVEAEGKYTATTTYTVSVSATVKNIEADSTVTNNKPATPSYITIAEGDGKNEIKITLDKAGFAKAVKEGGLDSKKTQYKNAKKAVNAVAKVIYKGSDKADTLKLTITPPTLTKEEIDAAAGSGTEPEENVTVTVTPSATSVEQGGNLTFTAEVKKGETKVDNATVTWSFEATEGTLKDGGNTKFGTGGDANKLTIDDGETATKLKITATYTEGGTSYTGNTTVSITAKTAGGGGV